MSSPDPEHFNRPLTYPRFPGNLGVTIEGPWTRSYFVQRSRFLDTTRQPLFTLFMPGQSVGRPYPPEVPETWPPAGAPLRVPKVLFLTSCPPAHLYTRNFTLVSKWSGQYRGYLGHHDDSHARDTRPWSPHYAPPQSVPYGSLVFDGFTGGYEYIGWACDPQNDPREEGRRLIRKYTVVQNPIVPEHERLVAEFRIAKSTLEAKYPGQVFVQVCEFFPADPALGIAPYDELRPKVLDVYTDAGAAANTPKHFCNGPTWMLGPDLYSWNPATRQDDGFFFGTDFAHIYCGYQASDNVMGTNGFPFRGHPSLQDLLNRYHWDRLRYGYPLDASFQSGYDQFVAQDYDGYEGPSYEAAKEHFAKLMSYKTPHPDGTRDILHGKLDFLRAGFRKFAGYTTLLHQYDLAFDFGSKLPDFRSGPAECRWPRGDVLYEDQDWVEQSIVLGYDQRRDGDPNPYNDNYYPGFDYDQPDGGGYNFFQRYPGTDMYLNTWVPALQGQHTLLKKSLNDLGPKAAQMWDGMIEEDGLGELNFSRPGGSSIVTSDYIVSWAEGYWGLKERFDS